MTDVDAFKKKLTTLQSAQKENEQAVMRAEIEFATIASAESR